MSTVNSRQRRSPGGSNNLSPMLSTSILATHRKPDSPKLSKQPFLERHYRTIGLLLFVLCVFFLFWNGTVGLYTTARTEYSIVFDAGSTGSRVHLYTFSVNGQGRRILLSDDFHQLKPGLSSYAGEPQKAAESLLPLLEEIKDVIPEEEKKTTPCELRATAGLRLLPGNQASDILDAVRKLLMQTPYSVNEDSISILDGKAEGAFAWLNVNYLLEKLDAKSSQTATTIDLGGGSVQQAYEDTTQSSSESKDYFMDIHTETGTKSVYVHSYLSYGLMAARSLILNATSAQKSNPCIPPDYNGSYSYGGVDYKVTNTDKISALKCRSLVSDILDTSAPCGAPADQCTFNGVWGGPKSTQQKEETIYMFSYFWDRAVDVGIVKDAESTSLDIEPDSFTLKSHELCSLRMMKLKEKYPKVEEAHLPFLCMDLTFISALLMDGYKLDPYHKVVVARQINYRGENFETAWPLGAAIDSLSKQAA